MHHIYITIKRYLLRLPTLCTLVGLSVSLQAVTAAHQPNPQKIDCYTLQKYSNQVTPIQKKSSPIALVNSTIQPSQSIAVAVYDYTNQCYYAHFFTLNQAQLPNYHRSGPWQASPYLAQQPNMIMAQSLSPNTTPSSAMPPSYSPPSPQQVQLGTQKIVPPIQTYTLPTQVVHTQPHSQYNRNIIPSIPSVASTKQTHNPPIQTYTLPTQVVHTQSHSQYNRNIIPSIPSVASTKKTHNPPTLAAHAHHKPTPQPTQPTFPTHQLLIPANRHSLYTTIIMGYLLPVRQAPDKVIARIDQLFGMQPAIYVNELCQNLQNLTYYLTYLRSDAFNTLVNTFMARMKVKKETWGGSQQIQTIANKLNINIQTHHPHPSNPINLLQADLTKPARSVADITLHIVRDKAHPAELPTQAKKAFPKDNPPYQHYRLRYTLLPPISHKKTKPQKSSPYATTQATVTNAQHMKLLDNSYHSYNINNHNNYTALIWSAEKGYINYLKYLVQQGADVNTSAEDGYTALLWCAKKGHLQPLKFLVQKLANIHAHNKWGNTALLLSAQKGHLGCLKYLVEQGADIHHKNKNGNTALTLSAENGYLGCLNFLVQQGANIHISNKWDNTALLLSAYNGHLACLTYLLQQKLNIHYKNKNGNTVLLYSAENGHLDCLDFLLQHNADINITNKWSNTALILSAYNGHLDCLKLLVKQNAYLHHKNKNGDTALNLSAKNGHLHCLKYLLQKGADIHSKNKWGNTPLLFTTYNGHLHCLKYLHQKGADINSNDKWGNTPLLLSARKGHADCLEYLLQQGAYIHAKDKKDGYTALHSSAHNGLLDCIKLLVQKGADIDDSDKWGNTALLWSAYNGHLRCVKYLVRKGADINANDQWGNTALLLSAKEGHLDCVNFLLTLVEAYKLNLQGLNLRHAILPADLSRANFTDTQLPQDLTNHNLTYTNLTGHRFTATNLDGTQLKGAILTDTLCDYQQCFQDNIKANQLSGSAWYRDNLPKDLKSIALLYPRLSENTHKATLLQIASGLAYLPYWKDTEFYIKAYYWSCKLLLLKRQLDSALGEQLVCTLTPDLEEQAQDYCWSSTPPKKQVEQAKVILGNPFDQYLNTFQSGLQQYNCQSKERWGYNWYKSNIEKNIQGLQKNYPKLTNSYHQQEAINIAFQLSILYKHQHWDLLFRYLFLQNRLIKLKKLAGVVAGHEIHYNKCL